MITHVAIRFDGRVWSLPKPNRHHHVIYHIVRTLDVDKVDAYGEDQGFLDEGGRYLTREEALVHARQCGQITETRLGLDELFSEDVW